MNEQLVLSIFEYLDMDDQASLEVANDMMEEMWGPQLAQQRVEAIRFVKLGTPFLRAHLPVSSKWQHKFFCDALEEDEFILQSSFFRKIRNRNALSNVDLIVQDTNMQPIRAELTARSDHEHGNGYNLDMANIERLDVLIRNQIRFYREENPDDG